MSYRDEDEDETTTDSSDQPETDQLAANDEESDDSDAGQSGQSAPLTDDQRQSIYEALKSKFSDSDNRPGPTATLVSEGTPQSYAQASDSTKLNQAIERAKSLKTASLWGDALEGLGRARSQARGGQGVDHDFWKGMAQQGQQGVQQAENQRQASINNFMTQNAIQRQVAQDMMVKGNYDQKMQASAWAKDQHDPDSTASQVARLAVRKLGFEVPETASAVDTQAIMKPAEIMASNDLKREVGLARAQSANDSAHARADAKSNADDDRKENTLDKLEKEFATDLNADKGRAGNYGKNAARAQAADRMNTLISQYKNPDELTRGQVAELARNLDAMLGGGTGGSVETFKAVMPQSMAGDASALSSYMTGGPKPANMGAFVNQIKDTVARERETSLKQMKGTEDAISEGYDKLRRERPDRFKAILNRSVRSAMSGDNPELVATGGATEDDRAIAWASDPKNVNDPRAKAIIDLHAKGQGKDMMSNLGKVNYGRQ